MKKYITAALLFCAALTAACSKETAGSADTGDTGALEMRVSATRAEADGEYDPLQRLAVRIYRASGELLRQYTAETLPSRLELLAGEYRVEVDAGEAVPASFTKRFYKGEKTFTVAAGQTTVAEVECKRQNVVAEVKFDATVSAAFGENFHAWVVAADAFDEGQVQQGGVPALNYTADGTGYFTMPEGATTLTTRFEGTHPDRGVIVREARFEGVQTGGNGLGDLGLYVKKLVELHDKDPPVSRIENLQNYIAAMRLRTASADMAGLMVSSPSMAIAAAAAAARAVSASAVPSR